MSDTTLLTTGTEAPATEVVSAVVPPVAEVKTEPVEPKLDAEGKPVAAEVKTEEVAKPAGAPEKYEFTAAEGKELAADVVAEVSALAKELDLPQDKAQKVLDSAHKLAAASLEAQHATIKTVNDGWIAAVKADPEVGGDKLAANLATAKAAMEASTTPEMRMLLTRTGLGNNVEFIRHFLKIAPAFAEGKVVPGGLAPTGDDKSAARVLYPNNP